MMMASEYVFRGITQSNEDPAIQVGIDYAHEPSGFYIGTWASSVEFNTGNADGTQIETNLYGGFAGSFANGIDWDIGGLYYYYPEEGDDDGVGEQDYVEVYGSLGYAFDAPMEPSISAGFYSPDYMVRMEQHLAPWNLRFHHQTRYITLRDGGLYGCRWG